MRVVLLGATGLVGSECLRQLIAQPEIAHITAIVRSPFPSPDPKVSVHVMPLERMDQHPELFHSSAVICALGTTIKKAGTQEAFRTVDLEYPLLAARVARSTGCPHYLLVSAVGADARSRFFYNRVKGETEQALLALQFERTTIVRPSLLLGDRKEFRPGEWFGQWFAPLVPKRYKPVQASAVARRLVLSLSRTEPGPLIIESAQI